uniref:Uncharacterized protein n=1 Tax=Amazona collaria TaxID=241587 RepID=A0A8B9FU07_9PSIT
FSDWTLSHWPQFFACGHPASSLSTEWSTYQIDKLTIRQGFLCKCLWILTIFMKIAETSNVTTETLPPAESEPVEIEVEIAEGMIEVEDDIIETLEVASAEQSIKYIQTTGTADASALALLADITSKYRQGERKCQIQEEDDSASDTLTFHSLMLCQ